MAEEKTHEELVKMVAENLEKFNRDGTSEPESKPEMPAEPTPDPKPEEKEAEPGTTEPTPEPEPKPEVKDTEGSGDTEVADDKPKLTDAYCRAAKHAGWTDEDIDKLYEANPELCITTLGKVYDDTNRVSQDYAAIGRMKKEKPPVVEPTPVEKPAAKSDYKGLDAEALRKKYPDDPMVDMIIAQDQQNKLMHDQIQESKNLPGPAIVAANQREQAAQSQEARAIEQQIDTFFRGDEAMAYGDFYGDIPKNALDWNDLTPGQRANRWAVLEMMDHMLAGATTCGKDMSIDKALEYAHLSISEPEREKVIRGKIIKDVKKRSSGLTLEPASSIKKDPDNKSRTREELVDVVREKMNKL